MDLKSVVARLQKLHPDWPEARLNAAVADYQAFLLTCKEQPDMTLTPTVDVDEVWHAHILHTKDYVRDCNEYFGYYLHHTPRAENTCDRAAIATCDRAALSTCDVDGYDVTKATCFSPGQLATCSWPGKHPSRRELTAVL